MRKNNLGFAHHLLLVLILLVAAIGGAGWYVTKHHTQKASVAEQTNSTLEQPLPNDVLSVDKIKLIAETANTGKTISALKLVKEDSQYIYKVRLDDGTVLVFDALTGQQLNRGAQAHNEDEQELKDSGDLPDKLSVAISFDQARSIALNAHDGTIDGIELEGENNQPVYKVEFTDGAKVIINATDGSVVVAKTKKTQPKKSEDNNTKDSQGSDKSSGDSAKPKAETESSGSNNTSNSSHNDSSNNSTNDSGNGGSGGGSGGDGGGSDDSGN